MEPCSFHERALLIERHLQKLRKLKYDFMQLEIKRKKNCWQYVSWKNV